MNVSMSQPPVAPRNARRSPLENDASISAKVLSLVDYVELALTLWQPQFLVPAQRSLVPLEQGAVVAGGHDLEIEVLAAGLSSTAGETRHMHAPVAAGADAVVTVVLVGSIPRGILRLLLIRSHCC